METKRLLYDVLAAHLLWIETSGLLGQRADLQGANLQGANLQGADLQKANLDFSCWPLWCGSKNVNVDEKQAKQLMAHALNAAMEYWPGGITEEQRNWLNDFNRIKSNEFPKF